jgi:hypothetical protein
MILPKLLPKITPGRRGRGVQESYPPQVFVSELGGNDILLGRGTGPNQNQGNIRFRKTVHEQEELLKIRGISLSRNEIALKILSVIKERRGRFLRKIRLPKKSKRSPAKEVFYVVDDSHAIQKIKQALRYQKKGNDLAADESCYMAVCAPVVEEQVHEIDEDGEKSAKHRKHGCDPLVVPGATIMNARQACKQEVTTTPGDVVTLASVLHDTIDCTVSPSNTSQEQPGAQQGGRRLDHCTTMAENASRHSAPRHEKNARRHQDGGILGTKKTEYPLSLLSSTTMRAVPSGIPKQEDKRSTKKAASTHNKALVCPRSLVAPAGGTDDAKTLHHQHDYDVVVHFRGRHLQAPSLHLSWGSSSLVTAADATAASTTSSASSLAKSTSTDCCGRTRRVTTTGVACQREDRDSSRPPRPSRGGDTIMIFDQNVITTKTKKFFTNDFDILRNDVVAALLLQQGSLQQQVDTMRSSSKMLLDTCDALLALKDQSAGRTIC